MVKALLLAFALIFAILGLCEFIHAVTLIMLGDGNNNGRYVVILLDGENAVSQLRYAAEQQRWNGDAYAKKVVAVFPDGEIDSISLCYDIANKNGIIICPKSALVEVLEGINGV